MDWDTRKGKRAPVTALIRVRINEQMKESVQLAKSAFEAQLTELSEEGVGLVSPLFLPTGALVDVEIPRSAFHSKGARPEGTMKFTGKIAYARPEGRECRMGLSFTNIDDADRTLIQAFVAAQEGR